MKNKSFIILLIILFLSLFIFLNWNSLNTPFERDEGEYAYSAWLLQSGNMPYKDSFLQKPPLIIYTYLLGQKISPIAVWPPRLFSLISVLLTSILIYFIAKKEWGEIAGIFSAFLFLPLINFPPLTPFAANTEKFMILPITGLLAIFIYYKNSQKIWPYIVAGFLSTLAIFYKPIALPVIIFIIIFYLYKLYKSSLSKKISIVIKPLLLILITSILTSFLLLIPFLKIWPVFWQEVFTFNLSYAQAFDNPFGNLWNYLTKFWNYWWILLFLLIGLFYKKPNNIFYYFTLIIISLFTIFSSPIGHYYLFLMPFLALFLGGCFISLLELLSNQEKTRKILAIIILIIILFTILVPFKDQFSLSPQELSKWVYGTVNPFSESKEVAKYLAQNTNIDDYVFVAGSEPQIYYYAQRKSPTRFIITYPLNLPTPYREVFQKELISDLEKNKPKAIVLSQRVHSGLWNEGSPRIFIEYFTQLLSLDYKIIGGYVWDKNGGNWQKPINDESIQNASLLLLIKK